MALRPRADALLPPPPPLRQSNADRFALATLYRTRATDCIAFQWECDQRLVVYFIGERNWVGGECVRELRCNGALSWLKSNDMTDRERQNIISVYS